MRCRVCESDKLSFYYATGDLRQYKYYICDDCTAVNYDLAGGLNQEKYTESYLEPEREEHKINRNQRITFNKIAKRFPLPGRMLEIGCGNGKILLLAREAGWKVRGIELSSYYAAEITKRYGIEVDTFDFTRDSIPGAGEYDLVVMRHVFEHLPDPLGAMRKIAGLLKPGGSALMEFPNIEAFDFKLKRWMERVGLHKKRYSKSYKPGHCNEYARRSFEEVCRRTGFELIKWETYSGKAWLNALYSFLPVGSKARVVIRKK